MMTGFEYDCAVALADKFKAIRAVLELHGLMFAKLPTKAVYEVKSYKAGMGFINRGTIYVDKNNDWVASDEKINDAIRATLEIKV